MNRYALFSIIGTFSLIALVGLYLVFQNRSGNQPVFSTNQTASPSPTQPANLQQPSITPPPLNQSTTNPPSTPTSTPTKNIILLNPSSGASVNRKFVISGEGRVFENTMQVRVTNKRTNKVLVNQAVMANSPDAGLFGPFSYTTNITETDLKNSDQLLVEAFQYSAKDGSEIDKTSATVNFKE